jgi:hypothetical protein
VTVNGGNISGNRSGCHVVYAWNAELTINDGTFYNNNSGNATIMSAGTTKCTITGGTFGIKDGRVPGNGNTWTSCLTDTANTATMTVTGGTFNGGFRVQAGTTMTIEGGSFNDCYGSNYNIYGTVTVKGGTFTDATAKKFAASYLAEGYTLDENGAVIVPVAKIGDTYYATIAAAFEAAKDGEKVTFESRDAVETFCQDSNNQKILVTKSTVKAGETGLEAYDVVALLEGAFEKKGDKLVYAYEFGVSQICYNLETKKMKVVAALKDNCGARELEGRTLEFSMTTGDDTKVIEVKNPTFEETDNVVVCSVEIDFSEVDELDFDTASYFAIRVTDDK